ARPHPVTGHRRVAHRAAGALPRVIPGGQQRPAGTYGNVGLPLRTRRGVGVQLQRRPKGKAPVSRANVVNIPRITPRPMLRIHQVHKIVNRRRLTPALMPPVTAQIVKHAGKVTHSRHPRPGKSRAHIGICPAHTPIGRFVKIVGVIMWKTATPLVHPSDIHRTPASHIPSNLHVPNEKRSPSLHLHRRTPRSPTVT